MTTTSGWLARHRAALLVGAGFVAALLVVVLLGTGARSGTPLDPDNPDPGGAQAVARVLDDRGVEVTVARGADALEATPAGASTTVLVTSTDQLGGSTIERLLAHTGEARLVLAAPGPGTTESLGVSEPPYAVNVTGPRTADCEDPRLAGLSVAVDHALEYPVEDGGCFAGEHGSLVAEPSPGVVLLGADELLTNGQVLRADNAAAALRLLGQGERLVWYVPSLDDLLADDGVSAGSLLPRWTRPGLWLGTIAVLALIAWRARRLGPLATEPLSVVVKAIETTRSRGRLYRRAGDRGHAASALRGAARTRAAERLGLGSAGGDPAMLVRDVARHVGRPVDEVAALLDPDTPAPATDHELVRLATELAALDREVRRT